MINIEGDNAVIVFSIRTPVIDTEGEVSGYTLVDPTTLSATVIDPDGTSNTYVFGVDSELTNLSTGVYRLEIGVATAGGWRVQITTTSPAIYDEQKFTVGESAVWDDVPPIADYENFTGTPASSYSGQALEQATTLFQLATAVLTKPTDALDLRVYKFGIFQMAEALEAFQGSRNQALSPFREEEIGSYSYVQSREFIQAGIPTGVMWFDVAVAHFLQQDTELAMMHSSIGLFEDEDNLLYRNTETGRITVRGPLELAGMYIDRYTLLSVYGRNPD